VLIVDDDAELCGMVTEYLSREGFEVIASHTGEEGVAEAQRHEYAIVIIDVMLPQINGFEVLRRIRTRSRTPALMLSARGDDVDRIVGLELGADDYLAKPFNPRELVARLHAILRRTAPESMMVPEAARPRLRVGDVEMDFATRVVRCKGLAVNLTIMEFNLLEALLCRPGQVVTRQELFHEVLGRDFTPYDRSLDVHVSNLRKKLGHERTGVERIRGIRGVGYVYYTHPSVPASP
jgi:two-component system response regulator CpxR